MTTQQKIEEKVRELMKMAERFHFGKISATTGSGGGKATHINDLMAFPVPQFTEALHQALTEVAEVAREEAVRGVIALQHKIDCCSHPDPKGCHIYADMLARYL